MIRVENGTIERKLISGGIIPAATAAHMTDKSKVHIGMRTSTGRLVSICNNTRLNKPNALTNLRLDLFPQITCKQCIAGVMNAGANSYELIMSALNGLCREGEMLSMPPMEHIPMPNMNVPKPRVDEKVNPMEDRAIHLIKAAEELDLTNVEELLKVGTPEALELMAYLIKEGYAKLKEDCVITLI